MDSDNDETIDLFQEPEGYYQKEKQPTQVEHRTLDGQTLTLHLVGQNPLWVGASRNFLMQKSYEGVEQGSRFWMWGLFSFSCITVYGFRDPHRYPHLPCGSQD